MLNEKIKALRLAKNVTQVEMARALNISKQCLSNWENDNIQPSVEMLLRLANYFNVSADFLLDLNDRRYLEVSGLTEKETAHVQAIVNDLRSSKLRHNGKKTEPIVEQ